MQAANVSLHSRVAVVEAWRGAGMPAARTPFVDGLWRRRGPLR